MKPKAATEHEDGLLEYLEDIIGTSKYKEPIDDALVQAWNQHPKLMGRDSLPKLSTLAELCGLFSSLNITLTYCIVNYQLCISCEQLTVGLCDTL